MANATHPGGLGPRTDKTDGVQLGRIMENIALDPSNGSLSAKFYDIDDAGCSLLFRYLAGEIEPIALEKDADNHGISMAPKPCSPNNQRGPAWQGSSTSLNTHQSLKQISAVNLWNVNMGDIGFKALTSWTATSVVSGGTKLRLLDLRRNRIIGTSEMASEFVQNFSSVTISQSLQTLILSNNPLSPAFRRTLITLLPNIPSLRELGLSLTGMTVKDGKALGKYFANTSPPCRLVKFDANANNLGIRGIRHIVISLRYCYSLEVVELYANHNAVDDSFSSDDDDSSTSDIANAASDHMLDQVRSRYLMRNYFLKTNVKEQALELLKVTRVLMSKPESQSCHSSHPPSSTQDITTTEPSQSESASVDNSANFPALPNELKLAILAELAPNLSHSQFIRVIEYGSSSKTLPKVGFCLPTHQRPHRTPIKPAPTSPRKFGSLIRTTTSPSSDSNLTTLVSGTEKEQKLQEWLVLVGCDIYEPQQQDESLTITQD